MESINMFQNITFIILLVASSGGAVVSVICGAYALLHLLDPIVDYYKLALTTRLQRRARRKGLV